MMWLSLVAVVAEKLCMWRLQPVMWADYASKRERRKGLVSRQPTILSTFWKDKRVYLV